MPFRLVGTVFTVATFPGLVVAAAIQDAVVDRAGVPTSLVGDGADAYEVDYDAVGSPRTALVVTFLPVLVCSAVAATLLAVAVRLLPFWTLGWWICSWLGLAVGSHAFPDPETASAIRRAFTAAEGPARTVGRTLVVTVRTSALLSLFRFDVLYAAVLYYAVAALLLPGTPDLGLPLLPFG
ncbi:hypothetical protein HUG10_01590 [Halorarum halophilum]|uniref:Uncharacterized protein n=1 Tax=Halorarum halophilum TaxID=2743090 RepID=A0A7D5GFU7_9EURY|nr:hypothetical protein [Halobaculum halophilum]QLG26311.1 hypothetical protein HUG10_01590 [Halobaculum halophilum]